MVKLRRKADKIVFDDTNADLIEGVSEAALQTVIENLDTRLDSIDSKTSLKKEVFPGERLSFNLDADNGNDENDGSDLAPFKTHARLIEEFKKYRLLGGEITVNYQSVNSAPYDTFALNGELEVESGSLFIGNPNSEESQVDFGDNVFLYSIKNCYNLSISIYNLDLLSTKSSSRSVEIIDAVFVDIRLVKTKGIRLQNIRNQLRFNGNTISSTLYISQGKNISISGTTVTNNGNLSIAASRDIFIGETFLSSPGSAAKNKFLFSLQNCINIGIEELVDFGTALDWYLLYLYNCQDVFVGTELDGTSGRSPARFSNRSFIQIFQSQNVKLEIYGSGSFAIANNGEKKISIDAKSTVFTDDPTFDNIPHDGIVDVVETSVNSSFFVDTKYYARPILGVFSMESLPTNLNTGDRYILESDPTVIKTVGRNDEEFSDGAIVRVLNSRLFYTRNGADLSEISYPKTALIQGEELNLYLDPTLGNDSNSGLEEVSPLKTIEAIFSLLETNYQRAGGTVRINIAAGTHQLDGDWNFDGLTISGSGKIIITGAALEFPADYEYTLTPEFRFTDVFAKTKLQGDETSGNKLIFNNLSDLDLTYLGLIRVETQFNDSEKVKIDFVAVEEARPGASYDFGFGSCNEPEISYTKGRVIFSECFKPEFSNLLADLDSQTRARFNKCWGSASSGGIPHSYSGNGLPLIEYEECEGLILSGKIHYESPTISAPLVRVENCTRLSLSFSGQNTNTTGGEVVFTPFNSDLENSYLVYLVNSDVELNLNSPTSQSTYITGGGAIYADSRSQIDTRRGSGLDLIFYDSEGKLITSLLPSDEEVILESGSFLNSFDFKDEEGLYTLNSAAVLEELAAKDLPPILDGEEINLYLDPTAGDDANSGMDSALPVKTWAAITALAQKYRLDGGRLRIDVAAGTHAVDETWEINDDFIAGEGQIFLTGVQPSFEDLEYVFVPSFRILNFTLNTFLEFSDNNKIIVSKDGVVVDSLSLNNGLEARNCENFTATTLEVKSSVFCNNCKNPFARDLKLTEAGNNQADLVFIRCFDPYFENIIGTTSNEISFQFCEGDVKKSSGITIAEHPASTVATAVSYSNCKNLVLEGNFYLKGSNLRGKLINLLNSENIELDLSSYVNESGGDITFAPSGVATPQQQSLISIINSSVSYRLTQLPTDFFIKGFNSLYIDESSKVSGFNLVFDPQTSSYSTDRIPGDGRVVREIGSIIDGKDYQQSDGSFILQESAIARLDERVSNTIFESTGFLALQVSEAGDDANDGLTFPTAVRTLTRAKEIINSEYNCADSSVLILLADSVFNLDETLVIDSSWKCRSLTIIGQTLKWSDGVSSACILIDNNLEGTAGDSLVEPRGSTPLVILEDFTLEPPSTGNVMGLRVENGSRAIVNRVKFQQNNLFHLFVRHSKVYSYDGFSFDGEARTGIYLLKDSEINIFDAIAVNGTQNYSSEFLRVRDNSKFRCLTSTVFNTGATVTGKKYNFESQSEAYFKTDDPQYDTLEKLIPGDLAGTIAPNCIVNGDRLETSNAIAQLAVKAEQIPRIQSGIQQVSAAGTVQTNITFPQQFATVPNVQVTLITDGSGTFTDRGLVLEGEPTTTGFTVKGVGNVTALDKISWIAIAN